MSLVKPTGLMGPGIAKIAPELRGLQTSIEALDKYVIAIEADNARLDAKNGKLEDEVFALTQDLAAANEAVVELRAMLECAVEDAPLVPATPVSGVVIPLADSLADNGALSELIDDSGASVAQVREVLATLAELPIKQVIRMTHGALAIREREKLREMKKATK